MSFKNNIASHLPKFRGNNTQNIPTWLQLFKAHCTMQKIRNARKLPCLEVTAFNRWWRNDVWRNYIDELQRKFSGTDYRRKLQVQLQSLVYRKGKNISSYFYVLFFGRRFQVVKYANKHFHFKLYSEENNGVEKFIVVIIMECWFSSNIPTVVKIR